MEGPPTANTPRQSRTHAAPSHIRLRGVRQNNLKGIDLDLPLGQFIVVTGLSGTGKSSLVFETLHAEGQRRYVETFSPYIRQFLEMLDRPKVDSIENIRPSIAIEQTNTVKTSRSTVGTMTELCDFFKVWFCHAARLMDPATGEPVEDDSPQSIFAKALERRAGEQVVVAFPVRKPAGTGWGEVFEPLRVQGLTRVKVGGQMWRLDDLSPGAGEGPGQLEVLLDRLMLEEGERARFIEAVTTALRFGKGEVSLLGRDGRRLEHFTEGLTSPATGRRFKPPTPARFSFNSPVGACPECRGFGRVIGIDPRLVIPDESLSLAGGAIKPFQGQVYSESLRDLKRAAKKHGIPLDVPWRELSEEAKAFVWNGEPGYGEAGREWPHAWYGINGFFAWLESNTYKMHVRVFLAKYRAYTTCPSCRGARLEPESLCWKWQGRTLPELYAMPVDALLELIEANRLPGAERQSHLAEEAILTRLRYLVTVGLGYLSLDRASRTLSGGEVERVNLTTCLGTALVDTLFVLDEPSVGLHARDIDRLVRILRSLVDAGNTVVVVEHDEAIMRAADYLVEVGPEPGAAGGEIVYAGPAAGIPREPDSLTGAYLDRRRTVPLPGTTRPVRLKPGREHKPGRRIRKTDTGCLQLRGITKHNLERVDVDLPLQRLVGISGVSGSGKSTLVNNALYQGLLAARGKPADDPAQVRALGGLGLVDEVKLADQSPVSKTPRSNPALYSDSWDAIRRLFALTDAARSAGFTASHFSFNAGQGRCDQCQGLGYERVEMQFVSDVFVPCPVCEGRRFKDAVLAVTWGGKSVADVLAMDVNEALAFFAGEPRVTRPLKALADVGLGYLTLGQPLNTLSGGESQRLKLVRYLGGVEPGEHGALLLLDEPTTGLHRHDIRHLLKVLHRLVDSGHTVVVIEHQMDVLAACDWLIELGPEAGARGGRIVAAGPPAFIAAGATETAGFLRERLAEHAEGKTREAPGGIETRGQGEFAAPAGPVEHLEAAEPALVFDSGYNRNRARPNGINGSPHRLELRGAREHNLRNLDVSLPHNELCVVTGVSGSGKSSLAFDIIFAEGQRRFMESMSAYARQFVEQLPRPDIDQLTGIAPTVAVEQRVTRGSRKSTVATVTEVAQYLRLLYAKVGIQHSMTSGQPVVAQTRDALVRRLEKLLKKKELRGAKHLYLCAPLVRARKGHHQPLADWAGERGYELLRCDGRLTAIAGFQKLDRYREHDIELVVRDLGTQAPETGPRQRAEALDEALRHGKGSAFLLTPGGEVVSRFSTTRTDPDTGEAYPDLDPKHFSWNSAKGWCETCRGHGWLHPWMEEDDTFGGIPDDAAYGEPCPDCGGTRLNPVSRAVYLYDRDGTRHNLPELLALTPAQLVARLERLKLDARGNAIAESLVPEIHERLRFMDEVGLAYLTLDRATATLSGGEAQRIRLAAHLGSNLSGVLYVLDEPSIGLHARDNARLIEALHRLRGQGNSLLVVEHDDDTMRAADRILDLGPGAGVHGGELLANGPMAELLENPASLTGRYLKSGIAHPLRGSRRGLPEPWKPRGRRREPDWLVLREPALRTLKGGTLTLPLRRLTMVCGISGAGKSTLIRDLLGPAVNHAAKGGHRTLTGKDAAARCVIEAAGNNARVPFRDLLNGHVFRSIIEVDQSPIGKTPRSTPATYMGAFEIIRDFFASLPEARLRGYKPGTFSFNTAGGRCETCKGAARVKLEMSFMPDAYVPCEECGGRRYARELDDIRMHGKSIADVLRMSFEEAAAFFHFHTQLKEMLGLMVENGLGYLRLGQSSPTLSGGEAQRLKLVSELARGLPSFKDRTRGTLPRNFYVLEEPTIGLHLSDCERLIELLHRLVDQGHTVIVIEHHLDLLAEADYLVEIGPDGGHAGGEILYQGPPQDLRSARGSPTWPFLKEKV